MAPQVDEGRYTVQIGWRHVPHLTEKAKRELLRGTPPHLREARINGRPVTGRGRIFPLAIEELQVDPFPIPELWPRVFGMDTGWIRTAGLWAAHDRDSDCVYLYSEYYRGERPPALHAKAFLSRGDWLPGVIDPAAGQRSQSDGERLIESYRDEGLNLHAADNAMETGLKDLLDRMTTGRLRAFRTLTNFEFEFNLYHRDDKGRVVRRNDHLMSALRYVENTGLGMAKTRQEALTGMGADGGGWRQRAVLDRRAGY